MMFDILTKEFLESISMESSLGVNLANYSMSKFKEEDLDKVVRDLRKIQLEYEWDLIRVLKPHHIAYRIKSVDSLKFKVTKYKENTRKAILCFNDLLGLRIIREEYPDLNTIPDYFQIIDLTQGKKENDDGYRAVHLYYKCSNRHYPIEIQIWKSSDENFINWSHKYCYKSEDSVIIRHLRDLYDEGKIVTENDFKREFDIISACSWCNCVLER